MRVRGFYKDGYDYFGAPAAPLDCFGKLLLRCMGRMVEGDLSEV